MERLRYIKTVALCCVALLASCDDFLDKNPDNRATIDTEAKIYNLLVSAYPEVSYAQICELTSDNTDDNGAPYTPYTVGQQQTALWEDVTDKELDTPYALWEACYASIAAANQALRGIADLGSPTSLDPARGEALLCRAYCHWILVNVFSKGYSPLTSGRDAGIPYIKEPETSVSVHYDRGTVASVYADIERDLLEGLPLISDVAYSVPKYHFNEKAARAFASRFYLFYVQPDKSNYERVIEYSDDVLGDNPLLMLRDWKTIGAISPNDQKRALAFSDPELNANLMLQSVVSTWVRVHGAFYAGTRYSHTNMIANTETLRATGMPWGGGYAFNYTIQNYTTIPKVIMDKMAEYYEYLDKEHLQGLPHIVFPAFTAEEVLFNRAEAYAMLDRYDQALADINTWIKIFCNANTKPTTISDINIKMGDPVYADNGNGGTYLASGMEYYTLEKPTPKKELHPDFTVTKGVQENMIQTLLYMRRVTMMHEGMRWFDVKRYGITIHRRLIDYVAQSHTVTDTMDKDDPRRAIQLPQGVIDAGMVPNER